VIKATDVFFSYTAAAPWVLEGINLEIRDGEYVSVVGENGCGKTTLMRLLLRFLKPCSGAVEVTSKRIGYVPQKSETDASGFPITVGEALDSYRRLLGIKDKGVIQSALSLVGMAGAERSLMGSLSGGQSQKVLLARAIMGGADLLILDEPSSGVDPASQKEIYRFLKTINAENNITIVSVEHNLDAAVSNSTKIYHLTCGKGHLCTPKQYVEEYVNV